MRCARLVTGALSAALALVTLASAADITCISAGGDGLPADGDSRNFGASRNGRLWAYSSFATNLVAGDENDHRDVFVFDRKSEKTELVSVASDGTQGDGDSHNGRMTGNGRFVVFQSAATNLVPGDTNEQVDVFVRDLRKGTTVRISTTEDGTEADEGCAWPNISANGRYIAYRSSATTLVPGDTNGVGDVFVFDRKRRTTERASFRSDGSQTTETVIRHTISPSGRFVAFVSAEDGIVPDDSNGLIDVFVVDRKRGTVERVSRAYDGGEIDAGCFQPGFPLNDRYVTYPSEATNLVPGDTNGVQDVFRYDRKRRSTTRVTVLPDGSEPNDWTDAVRYARGKRLVLFRSAATNWVADDTNGVPDVFLMDTRAGTVVRLSENADGVEGNNWSSRPIVTRNGRLVSIFSSASNLVPGDDNETYDVFLIRVRR
jgi:hypothetical protein